MVAELSMQLHLGVVWAIYVILPPVTNCRFDHIQHTADLKDTHTKVGVQKPPFRPPPPPAPATKVCRCPTAAPGLHERPATGCSLKTPFDRGLLSTT
jgi:hypothetical protein